MKMKEKKINDEEEEEKNEKKRENEEEKKKKSELAREKKEVVPRTGKEAHTLWCRPRRTRNDTSLVSLISSRNWR